MLIACGGLRALVQLLDEDYLTNNSRAMVWLAVDGIYRILEMRARHRVNFALMVSH